MSWQRIATLLLIGLLGLPVQVVANMRLPEAASLPPSSTLFLPARSLKVMHEDLQFDCDMAGCEVSATYRIRAQRSEKFSMSFISPSQQVKSVIANGSYIRAESVLIAKSWDFWSHYGAAKTQSEQAYTLLKKQDELGADQSSSKYQKLKESLEAARSDYYRLESMSPNAIYAEVLGQVTALDREACSLKPDLAQGWTCYLGSLLENNGVNISTQLFGVTLHWELYQFNFEAQLLQGENTVQVQYYQPYSYAEQDVGFFTTYPPIRYVSYELWPIKEWSRDPAFKIDLVVKFKNSKHGFLYLKRDQLAVATARFDQVQFGNMVKTEVPPTSLENPHENTLVFKAALAEDVPDRLFIVTGENPIIERLR
jgi:hypothetical protein